MKVREFICELQKFDPELEITITDGFDAICYHTNGVEIALCEDVDEARTMFVDIGIGGNRIVGA